MSLVILLHSICHLYCKASIFDRQIVEMLWKGAPDCERLIFIKCQFWCIFKKIRIFSKISQNEACCVFFLTCLRAVQLFCAFTLVCLNIHVVLLCCVVVLSSVLCGSACFVLQWFHPSARSLSHPRSLLTSFRLVLAWPRLALICHVLFCSCRFRLLLRVAFSFRFLRVVFCKSLVLSAALLYESPRRKLGWRFTAGSPYCSAVIGRFQGSAKIRIFWRVFCLFC